MCAVDLTHAPPSGERYHLVRTERRPRIERIDALGREALNEIVHERARLDAGRVQKRVGVVRFGKDGVHEPAKLRIEPRPGIERRSAGRRR